MKVNQAKNRNNKTVKGKVRNKSKFDINGSYTGVNYQNEYEKPIQDADDL